MRSAADWPPRLSGTDERGWFRFQRLYDSAGQCCASQADVRRLIPSWRRTRRAEGSGWLEIQVDPSGYAAMFGGPDGVHGAGTRRDSEGRSGPPASV